MILNRMRIEDWRVSYMTQEKFPFVGLESSDFVSPQARCGFIEVDSRNAFCELVEHLAANGHRRIAYIGGAEEFKIHHQRLQGYKDGLEAVGLTFDPGLVGLGSFESDGGYAHAHALLTMPDPPSAILCINDMTALGALQAAQDLGVKVGENLALSGFDGSDFTRHTRPSLTTIRQPLYDMACQLVDMLIQLVNGVPLVEPVVHLKPEIILRESTSFVL
jgi:LacI family transcriptional regulator